MRSIRLLAENDYDFSSVAGGLSLAIPLRQKLDVRRLGCANLVFRLHAANIPAGAYVALVIQEAAPTSEDPAAFFRGRILGVCQLDSTSTSPALVTAYAALTTAHVAVYLLVLQAPTAATFTCTLSADLVPRDTVNPWTPAQLAPLTLWLDERGQLVTLAGTTYWLDQSPAANNYGVTGGVTETPTNSWASVLLDGTSGRLWDGLLSSLITTTAYHGFAVITPSSFTAAGGTPEQNPHIIYDGSPCWGLAINSNGVLAWHYGTNYAQTTPIALTANATYLVEWSFDGSTLACRVNAGAAQTLATAQTVNNLLWATGIGSNFNATKFYAGSIATLLICNAHLSASDAAATRAYLSSKYGVPA